ncbi:MAG: lysophospholipid acyltransferase family protein [Gemmatimonadaceae bacterium]
MLPSARIVRGAIALARWMPPGLLHALGRLAGSLGWLVARGRREVLLENARHLIPGASVAVQRAVARGTMRNMLETATDLFRLPSLGAGGVQQLVETPDLDVLRDALAGGRGVIVVTPHLGAYELGGAWLAALGFPVHGLTEDIDPETNAALAAYRGATGMKLYSRNAGLRQLYRILKQGEILVLVADRVIGEGSEERGGGLVVPFGDAWRTLPTGPAALSLATGAPVIVGYIVRRAGGRLGYLIRLDRAIESTGRSRDELTRAIAARFNSFVCQHPDQWYVFQPNWLPRDPGH